MQTTGRLKNHYFIKGLTTHVTFTNTTYNITQVLCAS